MLKRRGKHMCLLDAAIGKEYIVKGIDTDDDELNAFLFSLGCYSGEPITVVSLLKGGCVVSIKDARYNIDNDLARSISV
jgi:Fe2+ transport system protein FeoA